MHKHAKIIMEWAQMMQIPESEWRKIQLKLDTGEWSDCVDPYGPDFDHGVEYRWAPRTIRIGDYDVPEPMRNKPETGTILWMCSLDDKCTYDMPWAGTQLDYRSLGSGIFFSTKEGAELMLKALLSLTQKKE